MANEGRGLAKQVEIARAPECGGARPILGRDDAFSAADEHDRLLGGLAASQVGGRGELVGDGDLGDAELATVGVELPAQVLQYVDAGCADRDVGDAEAPWPAEGVRDDDADARGR